MNIQIQKLEKKPSKLVESEVPLENYDFTLMDELFSFLDGTEEI